MNMLGSMFLRFLTFTSLIISGVNAQEQDTSLERGEVAAIKKKLVNVTESLGGPPQGYSEDSTDYHLPTDFSSAQNGKYWPTHSSLRMRFSDKKVKDANNDINDAGNNFQKKYAEAMASGDGEAMEKIIMEMQQKQQKVVEAATSGEQKEPINLQVMFNQGSYAAIDPDGVLFEKPGVIALTSTQKNSKKGKVSIYIDPVALKETKKLSKIELKTPNDGVSNKVGLYNITIEIDGSVDDIEVWAKSFKTDAMLALIDKQ